MPLASTSSLTYQSPCASPSDDFGASSRRLASTTATRNSQLCVTGRDVARCAQRLSSMSSTWSSFAITTTAPLVA
jgi:hypothetical protein